MMVVGFMPAILSMVANQEVLAGFVDPRSELVAFVDGHEGIDDDRVSVSGNQRGCRRGPRGDATGIPSGPAVDG